jgi:hypothetical protein
MSFPEDVTPGPVLLVADPNHEAMSAKLAGYESHRFRLRVWWAPDWGTLGVRSGLRWLAFREVWSPTATMDEWLYLRPDVARALREDRP